MRPSKWLSGQLLLGKLPEMRKSIISHHPNDLQRFEDITLGCEDSSLVDGVDLGWILVDIYNKINQINTSIDSKILQVIAVRCD